MQPRKKQLIDPDTLVLLKRIFTGFLVLAGVAVLVTAIWYGTRVQSLTLDSVEVSGGETIKHSEVEKLVNEELEGQYLGLVPRKFAWLYPKSDIVNSLDSIKRIKDIEVSRTSGTKLLVTFNEYVPRALWCDSDNKKTCFFLDDTGYAFTAAPKLSGGSFLRFGQVGQPAELKNPLTTPELFADLLLLADLLGEQGWFVSFLEIDQVGDAFLTLSDGGELKVVLSQTPAETVDNLLTVLSSEEFSHLEPGNFEYIDLRFGNKVFVNEEIAASLGGETASDETATTTLVSEVVD